MGRVCRDDMSVSRAFVATCRRTFPMGEGDRRRRRRWRGVSVGVLSSEADSPPPSFAWFPSPLRGGLGESSTSSRRRREAHWPQMQNGSRCCHRPPLVPGPNCRAGEGLASFLGGSNAIGASSSGVRGSGRGLATSVGSLRTPVRRTCRLSVSGSFGRSLRFRRTDEEIGIGFRLTLLPRPSLPSLQWPATPKGHRPPPRWSRLRAFFPEGKSALPREGPQ